MKIGKEIKFSTHFISLLIFTVALVFVFINISKAQANSLPPGKHYVERCAKIVNMDEFSDIAFIGHIIGKESNWVSNEVYIIPSNQCFDTEHFANSLDIYWIKKSDLITINIEDLPLCVETRDPNQTCNDTKIFDPRAHFVTNLKNIDGYYADDFDNNIAKETIIYSIQIKNDNTYAIVEQDRKYEKIFISKVKKLFSSIVCQIKSIFFESKCRYEL